MLEQFVVRHFALNGCSTGSWLDSHRFQLSHLNYTFIIKLKCAASLSSVLSGPWPPEQARRVPYRLSLAVATVNLRLERVDSQHGDAVCGRMEAPKSGHHLQPRDHMSVGLSRSIFCVYWFLYCFRYSNKSLERVHSGGISPTFRLVWRPHFLFTCCMGFVGVLGIVRAVCLIFSTCHDNGFGLRIDWRRTGWVIHRLVQGIARVLFCAFSAECAITLRVPRRKF
jgi:hypothetical protein